LCRQDSFLLDTEPETLQKLVEHLDKFIIADDVTLEDLTPALATIAVARTEIIRRPYCGKGSCTGVCYGTNVE
jgi:folate-binding Fe-S cluster repair protein YgfZ